MVWAEPPPVLVRAWGAGGVYLAGLDALREATGSEKPRRTLTSRAMSATLFGLRLLMSTRMNSFG